MSTEYRKAPNGAGSAGATWLPAAGEMAALVRQVDWSQTPLGPVEGWPQSLRSALSICLNARFPIALYWGEDLTLLYNDAWSPIPGGKHPWSLGRPAREVWPEIWGTIGPLFQQVIGTGEGVWLEDQLLPMRRHGYTEECYFNFTFSPVQGEQGGVAGIFNAVVETTYRVLGERRAGALRDLGERLAHARNEADTWALTAESLAAHPKDVPFACLYLLREGDRVAKLAGAASIEPAAPAAPVALALDDEGAAWPLGRALRSGGLEVVTDLPPLPEGTGPWPEIPGCAVVLPIRTGAGAAAGFLVAGVSARRALDADYREFFQRAAAQLGAAVSSARAYEEERQRAEALAEIDRAKTAFFSNVSHEFRTPLTLLLGPVEDLLAKPDGGVLPENREVLEVVHRSALRLQRLVNSLLDFTRIEAGRVQASFVPVDLCALTAELASVFRSAMETAGLRLIVECADALPEPVYVDRELWEKIVLNLLSNAFKFTFEGEVRVTVRESGGSAELVVQDTGIGVPEAELPRLFDRFHRVEGARGRTHEGTGIGLALVQEIVRLHGGTIRVESALGRGTAFTVSIPLGTGHLPPDQLVAAALASSTTGAQSFVDEALGWLSAAGPFPAVDEAADGRPLLTPEGEQRRARVLLVEDNADMRGYVGRLLSPHYAVEAVTDGLAALEAVRRARPDLVLSDVMMPGLDGFGLLRALREDPDISAVPVILLSARAGEEARIEGLESGADDYLTKPFSAKELVARVSAHLELARVRRESSEALARLNQALEQRVAEFETLLEVLPVGIGVAGDPECRNIRINPAFAALLGLTPGDSASKMAPEGERPTSFRCLDDGGREIPDSDLPLQVAAREGRPVNGAELDIIRDDGQRVRLLEYAAPLFDPQGRPRGSVGAFVDVTEQKRAAEALRAGEQRYSALFNQAGAGIAQTDLTGRFLLVNDSYCELTGRSREELLALHVQDITHPDDLAGNVALLEDLVARGKDFVIEKRYLRPDGSAVWVRNSVTAVRDASGAPLCLQAVSQDVTETKRAEAALREEKQALETVNRVGLMLAGELDLQKLLQGLTDEATGITGAEFGAFFYNTVREGGEAYMLYTLSGAPREAFAQFPMPRNTAIFGPTFSGSQTVRLDDVTQDPRYGNNPPYHGMPEGHLPVRSYLALPVTSRTGEVLGGLFFGHSATGVFTERHEAILAGVAAQAAIAIDNARLYQQATAEVRERRQAEERLRESEQLLRIAQEAAGAGVWAYEAASGKAWWSEGCHRVYGTDPATFTPSYETWLERVLPQDRDAANRVVQDAIGRGSSFDFEFRIEHPDRGTRWLQEIGQTFAGPEGGPSRMAGLTLDITERREAEQALRESEERFQIAARATSDAIWDWNLRTDHVWWNEGVHALFGYRSEQVGSAPDWWYSRLHPEDRGRATASVRAVLDGDQSFWREEYRFRRADGSYADVFDRGYVIRDPSGQAVRMIGAMQDLTERKRVEAALRLADRRKDEFLATLAHELRNPLAPIRTAARVLQAAGPDQPVLARNRHVIERQVGNMARLLDDLLDVSRITRGAVRLEPAPIDFGVAVGHALDSTRSLMEERGHTLSVAMSEGSLYVSADPLRLEQIAINLLNNAAKYTDPGGAIDVEVFHEDDDAVLRVSDSGRGITPELLPYIFDLFTQGERNLDRSQGGVGIGLTLVKTLVELHGGAIEARSEGAGRGAEFTVRLPLLPEEPSATGTSGAGAGDTYPEVPAVLDPALNHGRRVLVLDDNRDAADALAELATLWGYEVRATYDGQSALELAREYRPGVLFLDIGMPDVDGYEVARRLRGEPGLRGAHLVAVTGYGREEDRQRAREAGFDTYLTKPVDPSVVQRLLEGLFRETQT